METSANWMRSPAMTETKAHIRDLDLLRLEEFVISRGEPAYRYRQLCQWLYGKLAVGFDEMTDLPAAFRAGLSETFDLDRAVVVSEQTSRIDATRKFLFRMPDGATVESVLMPYEKRTTLCVSTQVGCPLDCVFCETAKGRFIRNLTTGEILDQICTLKREAGASDKKVNVVFMGMGEPLLNFDAVVAAIRTMNHPLGLNLGSKRITVSTSSFPDRIRQLADTDIQCSLALSLNAPEEEKRARLMPKASRFPIDELLEAARYFVRQDGRRVTLEYVMLSGINTSDADAAALARLTRGTPFKLNLIPYNPGRDSQFGRITEREIQRFVKKLLPDTPTLTVRRSRGVDIDAACGQLWTKTLAEENKNPAKGAD
jgi:23S rRNA (adenine2503-C2)-methyltransferase